MIDWSKYQSWASFWKLQPKKIWISSRHYYIPRCLTATSRMCATTKTRRATSTPPWLAPSITPLTRWFVFSVWKDPCLNTLFWFWGVDQFSFQVVTSLKETGQYENTIIVVTTDNGGAVKVGGNNLPLRGTKGCFPDFFCWKCGSLKMSLFQFGWLSSSICFCWGGKMLVMAPWSGVSLAILLSVASHLLEYAPSAPDGGAVV